MSCSNQMVPFLGRNETGCKGLNSQCLLSLDPLKNLFHQNATCKLLFIGKLDCYRILIEYIKKIEYCLVLILRLFPVRNLLKFL